MEVKHLQNLPPVQQVRSNERREPAGKAGKASFADVLKSKLPDRTASVRFSAHAAERLASRNIVLTRNHLAKLDRAVQTMEQKGGKEGLVVMDNLAMIVNVKNKNVVTAVEKSPLEMSKVFTNIDSALIM